MNSEIKLYKYIKKNNGFVVSNYKELAKELSCSISTIKKWKNALVDNGYATFECRCIHNHVKKTILTIIKEIDENE